MRKKTKAYRLFAMEYSLENVDYASAFRFSRITSEYILIYAQKAKLIPPTGVCAEVREENINLLTKLDESWLIDCGVSLFADATAKHDKEVIDRLTSMVERFGIELESELAEGGEERNESA